MATSKSPGIGKLVFGLEKLSPHAVKLENGRILYRPPFDCRPCALLNLVCEELDYPCAFLLRECGKRKKKCEACRRFAECLEEKPCCWDCPYLMECLKMAKEGGGEAFVKFRFQCSWEEFEAAVKMLAGMKRMSKIGGCWLLKKSHIQSLLDSNELEA